MSTTVISPTAELQAPPRFASNLAFLYAVHIFNYMVPFVTVPYLARILGVGGLGDYSFAESCGRHVELFVEYGFALSATRDIARHRHDSVARSELLAGVLGAQWIIIGAIGVVCMIVAACVPQFWPRNSLFLAAGFWAVCEGCGLIWYFQGLERIRVIAWVDIAAKSAAIAGIFLWVRQPSDVWRVLALRGAGAAISLAVGLVFAYRDTHWTAPTFSRSFAALRDGATMFLYRSATALSTASNVIVLGFVATPEAVGYYAGAEKISRAAIGLLQPITQALLPRMSHSIAGQAGQVERFKKLGLWLMGTGGVALGLFTWAFAPWVVSAFLGKGYEPAVAVLRVLALLHPIAAINSLLGLQWMLPLRMDRAFISIAIATGLLNVTLAAVLADSWGQMGSAWAVLAAQGFALALFVGALAQRGVLPMPGMFGSRKGSSCLL